MISTNTAFIDSKLVVDGILPPESPISQFFGGKALRPEKSRNISAGIIVLPTDDLSITLDYFRIKLTDRIGLTSNHEVTDAAQAILEEQGVEGASTIANVRFFANGYSSMTQGFDLAINYQQSLLGGSFGSSLGFNHSSTEILHFDSQLLNQRAIINIENMVPNNKGTARIFFKKDNYTFHSRLRYFGPWSFTESDSVPEANKIDSGSETMLDVSLDINIDGIFSFSIGAENILDNKPDRFYPPGDCCGRIYSGTAPYASDGGFFYLKFTYYN